MSHPLLKSLKSKILGMLAYPTNQQRWACRWKVSTQGVGKGCSWHHHRACLCQLHLRGSALLSLALFGPLPRDSQCQVSKYQVKGFLIHNSQDMQPGCWFKPGGMYLACESLNNRVSPKLCEELARAGQGEGYWSPPASGPLELISAGIAKLVYLYLLLFKKWMQNLVYQYEKIFNICN